MQASKEDRIKDLDEINYVTGCSLDVEQLVHNEILIHWPLRVLCKEDCLGICPKCGRIGMKAPVTVISLALTPEWR